MRYPADQKAKTRRTILEAAARVFKRRGYQGGGVDAVMKEAGLTHGGFYAHFKNKEALLAETLKEAMLEARGRHLEWTEGARGEDWLGAYLDGYLSPQHFGHMEQGCPVPPLVSEVDRASGPVKASFEDGLRVWANDIAQQLHDVPEADRESAALGVIATSVGAIALSRAVADADYAGQVLDGARDLVLGAFAATAKNSSDSASPDSSPAQENGPQENQA